MIDTDGKFYLGKIFDPKKGKNTEDLLLYDPEDLTTHGVVVGMTGSGKTGLAIGLLEEAALNKIPALLIDPKGDITNELLHFPDLLPEDFEPWINKDDARREGISTREAAEKTAALWKKGLASWGIGKERIQQLKERVHYAIYTPGSDAGIPVSILASLKAPDIPWEENKELIRERISGTVTALLGLVGMKDIDPVRSREHILLSNIFENAWRQGKDLDLSELILQTQSPPFEKLGVFAVDTFFPEKDRFELAMLLNNIMAAPAFQTWIEGQPLDIPSLLYDPDGEPRHSVFYIAHLNDEERMFFVTLLYSAIETWMRTQGGTSSLRAIIYFDEIFGYLPPVGNPPSKEPMMRMLKQARAFGVGQLLVTQNPVDLDYKALSNAGTWFIGKLQTDQDKQRLLDGLEGVLGGGLDRKAYDQLISRLGKRIFLLKNVHEKEPALFNTRWVMNYLAGPLTRIQIPALNKLAGAEQTQEEGKVEKTVNASGAAAAATALRDKPGKKESSRDDKHKPAGSTTRPRVPSQVGEYFLPNNLTLSQAMKQAGQVQSEGVKAIELLYRPVLLAQANIRFIKRKYDLDMEVIKTALVQEVDKRGSVNWEDFLHPPIDERELEKQPVPESRFASLESPLSDGKLLARLKKDFVDWVYHETDVNVWVNEELDVFGTPDLSREEFLSRCEEAVKEKIKAETRKVTASYDRKISTVEKRLNKEERELEEDKADLSNRRMEEWGSHAETVLSLFGGRKRKLSTSLSKHRMAEKAKQDVKESEEQIAAYQKEIEALGKEKAERLKEIEERWHEAASEIDEVPVTPYKKDILVELFGIAWYPYHVIESNGETFELPAYRDGD